MRELTGIISKDFWLPVVIESPFMGEDQEDNVAYARACMRDCLMRGEAPFASHLLYTQEGVLDDSVPAERRKGIEAGLAIGAALDATIVVYIDRGLSEGMIEGIRRADLEHRRIIYRSLGCHQEIGEVEFIRMRKDLIELRKDLKAKACALRRP